jgi:hypothetical protein
LSCAIDRKGDADTPHYQHTAQWIFPHFYIDKLPGEINILGRLVLQPFLKVAVHEDDIVQEPSDLSRDGFIERFSEITAERFSDPGFIVLYSTNGRECQKSK